MSNSHCVEISVSDVRQQIYFASSQSGPGNPSQSELGTTFHRLIASLLHSSEQELSTIFSGSSIEDWVAEMKDLAYRKELGPYLVDHAAALHGRGAAVLDLWTAVGEATRWLAELFWDHRQRQLRQSSHFNPREFAGWFRNEVPLRLELTDPNWRCPVVLTGIADSLLTLPQGRRCVIEYKLGKTAPEADLCQTALYHWMLEGDAVDSLAVVSFLPEKSERMLDGSNLKETQSRLKTLIGKLANVTKSSSSSRPSPPQTTPTPSSRPHLTPTATTQQSLVGIEKLGKQLKAALVEAGCDSTFVGAPILGPTFVRFTVSPARGIAPKKFLGCGDLLQVRMQLKRPPVIQIGASITIDLQRPDRQIVPWSSIELPVSDPLHGCAKVLVGVGIDGKLQTADLADTASYHLLVAGTSGSGKSEWLRTAVAGLIATNTTEQLQIVAIDPKRVAFHDLQGSPYLRRPVVFPGDEDADMVEVFDELIDEMERRYAMLEGCSSLAELIDRRGEPIPRIVCVCDEYADLMLGSASQRAAIEMRITRLGAKARASGIHLVLATQQPSRKTITGAIQTNLPGRVGLTMTSATESRMLFGEPGAENLLMKGDLLYKDIGDPKRYQAVYLSDNERRAIYSGSLVAEEV
ncbi:FtsK/SpoIIIE domain-containing protein [Aporhodopirellula aestuarii]|uniref:FtsK/SpoIIIE domain-containing protein n=1 Tax=Aporhodopirellula aestuarii TaxID=2950107 RepID=A0ABT0TWL5_9BACT|nr:FtsK/SpoIIIE domain-containing protein [Aporhodopirellula aestuarii]MCM2369018.1 FtsK/SpoIIIE domain-containing protein [Aporhodopirellula aestuarii]